MHDVSNSKPEAKVQGHKETQIVEYANPLRGDRTLGTVKEDFESENDGKDDLDG